MSIFKKKKKIIPKCFHAKKDLMIIHTQLFIKILFFNLLNYIREVNVVFFFFKSLIVLTKKAELFSSVAMKIKLCSSHSHWLKERAFSRLRDSTLENVEIGPVLVHSAEKLILGCCCGSNGSATLILYTVMWHRRLA